MKQFDYKRILLLWKQRAALRKRTILLNMLSLFSGLFIYNMLATGLMLEDRDSGLLTAVYYLTFCIYLSVCMSLSFSEMQTKEGRIACLTLPASQAEKFVSGALWAVVVPTLIFLVAALLNDVVRLTLLSFHSALTDWRTQLFVGKLAYCGDLVTVSGGKTILGGDLVTVSGGQTILAGVPAILTGHVLGFSFYLLGACIWYKHVFLKTFCAIGVCWFLLMLLLMGVVSVLPEDSPLYTALRYYDFSSLRGWSDTILTTAGMVLTLLVWWTAWQLFRRREAISQKTNWLGIISR